jgi:hypothetical protein
MSRQQAMRRSFLLLATVLGSTLAAPAFADVNQEPKPSVQAKPVAQEFRAQRPPAARRSGADKLPEEARSIFIGASGGLAYASFKQSELASTALVGPMVAVQIGYRLDPSWAVSIVYTDFQRGVARNTSGELFGAATSLVRTQADCNKCTSWSAGGAPTSATFRLATVGPAVDVTPFGKQGPFIGASGGLAISAVTQTVYGGAGTARAGLRLRPIDAISIGIEGGIQGQVFPGGSAKIGYGAAELRLGF